MLEVHPPHQPARSWTEFFIHIATIVLGLLIAIALEQMVERIHENYELRVAREALEREFQSNRANLAADESNWLETLARLKNNLLVLEFVREHPKTPQTELPGELQWHQDAFRWDHAVWDTAENKGIVRLMSLREANRNQAFYRLMTLMSAQSLADWDAINDAHHFDLLDSDPTHLSAQQLNEAIQLTEIALAKHIEFGYSFGRYAHEFPDLPHSVTWEKIDRLRPSALDTDPSGMAAAHQRTEDRIKAAMEEGSHGAEVAAPIQSPR
jgi:hypothetical protein